MYNLLISAAVAVVAFLLVTLTAGFHYWWAGLIAALLLFMGSFLLIARIVTKKLEAIMEPFFDKALRKMAAAFEERANELYEKE